MTGMVRRNKLWRVVLFACAAAAVYATQLAIDHGRHDRSQPGELMYFPSARFTRAAADGYDNLAGDIVWLDIIQYYGRHSLGDMEFRYLKHMLQVLTVLTPRFVHGYTFGALLLITDCNDPAGAFAVLETGMENNPAEWMIPFTRGFFHYVFYRDYREAGRWFTIASRMPDAPEMAGRFAAFSRQRGHDLATARLLWQEIHDKSRNQTERLTADRYIRKIDRQLVIGSLQQQADAYRKRAGRPPASLYDLVRAGDLRSIPPDPMGGRFVIDQSGTVAAAGGSDR